ncbi:hypothetical protein RCXUPER_240 [Rhodobacter phage RcXuper]|nr:hypothetical protein RCXUPER_240 [Rhodobacter phage RcXuper]
MSRYRKTVNVWTLSPEQRAALPIGQWVSAGEGPDAPKGRYLGQTPGSDVVAWLGNGKGRWRAYFKALRDYAKGRKKTA